MAYTFGAATSDRVNLSGLSTAALTTSRNGLVCIWAYPTTLTAGRYIWSTGAISGLSIDTTTTSVRMTLDAATTDGVFTAPAALAVNKWTFIAVLWTMATGPTGAIRIWTGEESTPPVEQTVTVATTPVGAWTSGGSTFSIGNTLSAGVVPFQGDLGGLVLIYDSSSFGELGIGVGAGVATQLQADLIFNKWICPAWRGDIGAIAGMGRQMWSPSASLGFVDACSLDAGGAGGTWQIITDAPLVRATVTGATISAQRTPHSFDANRQNLMINRNGRRTYLPVT